VIIRFFSAQSFLNFLCRSLITEHSVLGPAPRCGGSTSSSEIVLDAPRLPPKAVVQRKNESPGSLMIRSAEQCLMDPKAIKAQWFFREKQRCRSVALGSDGQLNAARTPSAN